MRSLMIPVAWIGLSMGTSAAAPPATPTSAVAGKTDLGLRLRLEGDNLVSVTHVERGGLAAKVGLRSGDTILTINGIAPRSTEDVLNAMNRPGRYAIRIETEESLPADDRGRFATRVAYKTLEGQIKRAPNGSLSVEKK